MAVDKRITEEQIEAAKLWLDEEYDECPWELYIDIINDRPLCLECQHAKEGENGFEACRVWFPELKERCPCHVFGLDVVKKRVEEIIEEYNKGAKFHQNEKFPWQS